MSHADEDEVYEHPIEHHDPQEGFDRTEPDSHAVWGFTAGSVAVLILVIVAVQGYFEQIYQDAVYEARADRAQRAVAGCAQSRRLEPFALHVRRPGQE